MLKLANIPYACKYGGAVRKTGCGIRPQLYHLNSHLSPALRAGTLKRKDFYSPNTMKNDCPAKIIVAVFQPSQQLGIMAANLEHNHEVSPASYKAFSECCQLNEEEAYFVRPLRELNVQPNIILEKLRQEIGKAVMDKDIHNLKCAWRGQDEVVQLMKELKNLKSKGAFEAARRLEEWLRDASSFTACFDQEVTHLRARLKDYCERLLFTAPLEYGHQAVELTWHKVYYDVVQHYKATKASAEEDSVAELRAYLHSGLGYYQNLLLRLQIEAEINLENNVDVPLIREYKGLNRARYLIELGDSEPNQWAALSARYYWQALSLDPGSGMPHNRLGALAAGDTFKAAYHFLRCLQSSQPYEGAQENLFRLLDKNNKQPSSVGQLKDGCKPSALFTSGYLRLCEKFYTVSDTSGLKNLCEECLSQLTAILEQPEDEAELVFQAATMSIICADMLHKSALPNLSNAAAAFTLNMFSHVTATCCHLMSQCSLTGRHQGADLPAVPDLLAESTPPQDNSSATVTNGSFPGATVEKNSSSSSPLLSSAMFPDFASSPPHLPRDHHLG
ncbi:hypothetical protein MRX96_033151 [Rhipicephalus microplus]